MEKRVSRFKVFVRANGVMKYRSHASREQRCIRDAIVMGERAKHTHITIAQRLNDEMRLTQKSARNKLYI